ncbi:MAG TPA: hypothetical protein VLB69_05480 [Rudaea sp.]|nr:hypothetical protein [Rudaea sp.]
MMNLLMTGALLATGSLYSAHSNAMEKTDCELRFSLKGWAALYKHAEGTGVITCDNGKSFPVNIVAVGGGLTAGKYQVDNGKGKFSDVTNTNDLFGDYAQGEANAALVKGGSAQVLTKGTVSLALAGAGEGVDLGISFGKFTISRAK